MGVINFILLLSPQNLRRTKKMAKNRNWFNGAIAHQKYDEFVTKYPTIDEEEMLAIAKDGSLKEFRLLCNALYEGSYTSRGCFYEDYQQKLRLVKACNERVNTILGPENAELYDKLMRSQKHERWGGDERYRLFGYDFAPYDDRQVILSIVELKMEYLNKPLTVENIPAITDLYNHGRYWDLFPERSSVGFDWENDDRDFRILNKDRQKHVEIWISFMNCIFNQEYQTAYNKILWYDIQKEKVRAEERKRFAEMG